MRDILSLVDISHSAAAAYQIFAQDMAGVIIALGIDPGELGEEQGENQPDGSLLIWLDLPWGKGKMEFVVPKGEWVWHNRN